MPNAPRRQSRRRHAQARAASTSTAETAGAAAAGDVGAAGAASAVAELNNPSARADASTPGDIINSAVESKHTPARAASTSTAKTVGAATTADAGAAESVTAVTELDDYPFARTRARTSDVTRGEIRVTGTEERTGTRRHVPPQPRRRRPPAPPPQATSALLEAHPPSRNWITSPRARTRARLMTSEAPP